MDASILENQIKQQRLRRASSNKINVPENARTPSSNSSSPTRTPSTEPKDLPPSSAARRELFPSSSPAPPKANRTPSRSVLLDTSVEEVQLRKLYLDEAPPLPEPVVEKPQVEENPAKTKIVASKVEDENFSDVDEGRVAEDDDWETDDRPKPTQEQVNSFSVVISELREWLRVQGTPLKGTQSIDEELRSGVVLCKLLAKISNNNSIFEQLNQDYTPALASLCEWKNLELFLKYVRETYPKLDDIRCEPKDLFNQFNIPNFFAFLYRFAKESTGALPVTNIKPLEVDVQMLQRQSPVQFANALALLDEDETKKLSPVYNFVKDCKFEVYYDNFIKNGWDTLEHVSLIEEQNLRDMGITKDGHIKLLLKKIQELSTQFLHSVSSAGVERAMEFHAPENIAGTYQVSPGNETMSSSDLLALDDARKTFASLAEKAKKLDHPGFRDAFAVASHLLHSVVDTSTDEELAILVVDLSSNGYASVGFAGQLVPFVNLPCKSDSYEHIEELIKRSIDKFGLSLTENKSIRIFLVGASPSRAIQDLLLKVSPNGMYICSPKSTAALSLRAVGLLDGISADIDITGVARVTTVKSGRAIPQGYVTEVLSDLIEKKDDPEVKKKLDRALAGMVNSSLSECGFSSSQRVRGGLVLTGTQILSAPNLSKRFSAGIFNLLPAARWSMASQIANHPDFQHRWVTELRDDRSDDQLFPLISLKVRKQLAIKACSTASHLERIAQFQEDALALEQVNIANANNPQYTTLTSSVPPASQSRHTSNLPASKQTAGSVSEKRPAPPHQATPPPRPPHPKLTTRTRNVPKHHLTKFHVVNRHIDELITLHEPILSAEEVIVDFKTFLLKDVDTNESRIANLSFNEVLQVLPSKLKKELKDVGVIIMDKDEVTEDSGDEML